VVLMNETRCSQIYELSDVEPLIHS
jgi:hypothetical protein